MNGGAPASARFTVRNDETLEIPGPFSICMLKRRERRAPRPAQGRRPLARYSTTKELFIV